MLKKENGKVLGYVLCLQYVYPNEIPRSYGVVVDETKFYNIKRKMTRYEEVQFNHYLFNEFATYEQKNFNPLA